MARVAAERPPGAESLLRYHERTNHTYESVRISGRSLEWANQPGKEKRYRGLAPIPLPRARLPETLPALEAIVRSAAPDGDAAFTGGLLSALLFFSAGAHRILRASDGTEYAFRTYASAGALYPIEVYVALAPGVIEAGPGLFHYHPREHALRRLRDADVRGLLAGATDDNATAEAPAALVLSGIPWRTAWKYGARGYRHLWWDAGMMLANLLSVSAASKLSARILVGFADRDVDHVLGIDGRTEMSLLVVPLGRGAPRAPAPALQPLDVEVEPISRRVERDPEIERAHADSSLSSADDVRSWRTSGAPRVAVESRAGAEVPLLDRLSDDPIEGVILRRGSSRRLARRGLSASEFAAILERAAGPVPMDAPVPIDVFLIASALGGLEPGTAYRRLGRGRLERRAGGITRETAGIICLEQRLGADAAALVFPMVDIEATLAVLGGRGYRAAQLYGAVIAGRLILGAYARCLGASGITFYDDQVSKALGALGLSPIIGIVAGEEARRGSIIECRATRRPS
jgi:SagB-type dehydrogenase family enzyme